MKTPPLFLGDWDRFMSIFVETRDVNLIGRKGSGKTLLAVAILKQCLADKLIDGVVSNIGVALPLLDWREILPPANDMPERVRGIEGAGILLDEAGTVLDNRTSLVNPTGLGRYGRKWRNLLVLPSVTAIDKRYTQLQIEPTEKYGPVWSYRWRFANSQGQEQEAGTFRLVNARAFFGSFSTGATPIDDAEILNLWEWTLANRSAYASAKQEWFRPKRSSYTRRLGADSGRGAIATIRSANDRMAILGAVGMDASQE